MSFVSKLSLFLFTLYLSVLLPTFCSCWVLPPLQTSHPLAQLINDCFNNITTPPFSCVSDLSDMWLVARPGRDFYFHPSKGYRKYRE